MILSNTWSEEVDLGLLVRLIHVIKIKSFAVRGINPLAQNQVRSLVMSRRKLCWYESLPKMSFPLGSYNGD